MNEELNGLTKRVGMGENGQRTLDQIPPKVMDGKKGPGKLSQKYVVPGNVCVQKPQDKVLRARDNGETFRGT